MSAQASRARLLPPHEQLTFTDGWCEVFAVALCQVIPDLNIRALVVMDARHNRRLDYPDDAETEVHVFCEDEEGWACDAEGRRSIGEMMASFGIAPDYAHEIVEKRILPPSPEDRAAAAAAERHVLALLGEHGWADRDIPRANGALSNIETFRAARRTQRAQHQGAPSFSRATEPGVAGEAPEVEGPGF